MAIGWMEGVWPVVWRVLAAVVRGRRGFSSRARGAFCVGVVVSGAGGGKCFSNVQPVGCSVFAGKGAAR
eukprot:5511301-Alexandrium_andersonii.AAC.1